MFKTLNKQNLQAEAPLRHASKILMNFGNIIRDSLLGNVALVFFAGEIQYLQTILPHKTISIIFFVISKLTLTMILSWLLASIFYHIWKITGKITVMTFLLYFAWFSTLQLVLYFSLNNFLHSLLAIR